MPLDPEHAPGDVAADPNVVHIAGLPGENSPFIPFLVRRYAPGYAPHNATAGIYIPPDAASPYYLLYRNDLQELVLALTVRVAWIEDYLAHEAPPPAGSAADADELTRPPHPGPKPPGTWIVAPNPHHPMRHREMGMDLMAQDGLVLLSLYFSARRRPPEGMPAPVFAIDHQAARTLLDGLTPWITSDS